MPARQGPAVQLLVDTLRELGAVDRAVYEAVARTPTGTLDDPVRRLSGAADKSRLWLGIAAAVALAGGGRGRRAALEGVVAIGVTWAAVNLGVKPVAAFGWGALGAAALLVGALVAYLLAPSRSVIAVVMALGTGLLIGVQPAGPARGGDGWGAPSMAGRRVGSTATMMRAWRS